MSIFDKLSGKNEGSGVVESLVALIGRARPDDHEWPEFDPELPERLWAQTSGSERRALLQTLRSNHGPWRRRKHLAVHYRDLGPRLFVEVYDAMGRPGICVTMDDWRLLARAVRPHPLVAWLSIGLLADMQSRDLFDEHVVFLREHFEPFLRSMLTEHLAKSPFENRAAAFELLIELGGVEEVAEQLGTDHSELAIEALVNAGEAARSAVHRMLGASRAQTRIAAAKVIESNPSSSSAAVLEETLQSDRSKRARTALQQALHECLKLQLPDFSELTAADKGKLDGLLVADASTLPDEVQQAELPQINWQDGARASDGVRTWILARLVELAPDGQDRDLGAVVELLAQESRGRLLDAVTDSYEKDSDERRIGWVLTASGYLGDDDVAKKLGVGLDKMARRRSHQQAFRRVRALRRIASPAAIRWLEQWSAVAKSQGLRTRSAAALRAVAGERGMTVDELVEELDPDARFEPRRLERSMGEARRWSQDAWRARYIDDDAGREFARALIWIAVYDDEVVPFRVAADRTLADIDEEVVTLQSGVAIGIAHPVYLSVDERKRWEEILVEYELVSPFSQFERDVFDDTSGLASRFAGRTLTPNELRFGLEKTTWLHGRADDGWVQNYVKPLESVGLTAVIDLEPGYEIWEPQWGEDQTLSVGFVAGVHYERPPGTEKVSAEQVAAEIYSETIREIEALFSD